MKFIGRSVLTVLLLGALVLAGCAGACSHVPGEAVAAAEPGFFTPGNAAHYLCAHCGLPVDSRGKALEAVTLAPLSGELFLRRDGQILPLTLAEEGPQRLVWVSEDLSLAQGTLLTVHSARDPLTTFPFAPEGLADPEGRITRDTRRGRITLTVTPSGLTLAVEELLHQGLVLWHNGKGIPLEAAENGAYQYGFLEVKAGDRLLLEDTVAEVTYGWEALAPEWRAHFSRGEDGAPVAGGDGCFLARFSPEEGFTLERMAVPSDTGRCFAVLSGGVRERISLTKRSLSREDALWELLLPWTSQPVTGAEDALARLREQETVIFSEVLRLEAGQSIYLELPGGDRLGASALGAAQGVRIHGEHVFVETGGTYCLVYLPCTGVFRVMLLTPEGPQEAVRELDEQIAAFPWGQEHARAGALRALYAGYQLLAPHLGKPKTAQKLEAMYQALTREASGPVYCLSSQETGNVYPSRQALFEGFFTDLYYYILAFHGDGELRRWEVRSREDFLELASDPEGAGYENFTAIGLAAGPYLLTPSKNSLPQDQTEGSFLGFALENGIYQDIIPFFVRFFAYWRIDEGYATRKDSRADFFSESWAPTVDIAKYFHYDLQTSYVQTPRMRDCFACPAGVVLGLEEGAPTLRGYRFAGWYRDKECVKEPFSGEITDGTVLYARWLPDEDQQDRDGAALVDVYLYNLSTQAARRSGKTVVPVLEMFDALSPQAQAMVENVALLGDYRAQFGG